MSDEINKKYESQHLSDIQKQQKKILKIYEDTIKAAFKKAGLIKATSKDTFSIEDYPSFSKELDKIMVEFQAKVNTTLLNGIKDQWELSIQKNADVIHKAYDKTKIIDSVDRMIYDPQEAALNEFINQKNAGLGLSDRVWKYTHQFKSEIEQNLYAGIQEGKSAVAMARNQIEYLDQPDKLFRRVSYLDRDGNKKLRLSKAAQAYKPGQGVYRSSKKNAMRLTRTINNDAYRQSDMVRYQSLPFVIGYNVNLSRSHPRFDICDHLAGTYPKAFIWLKWHIQCLCNCTSKLAEPEDFDKYQEDILNGKEKNFKFKGSVTEMPSQFKLYVQKNQGSMDGWASKPDWVTTNNIII